jgi:hypothetical protein
MDKWFRYGHITYYATMQNQGSNAASFQWGGGGF